MASLQKKRQNKQSSLKREIKTSIVFHLAILGLFSVKNLFFSGPDIDFKSAIRVDMVDLPDKIDPANKPAPAPPKKVETEKPKSTPKPKPTPAPKPKPKPVAEKAPSKRDTQKEAIDRLKAIENLRKEKEREDSQQEAMQRLQEYKGNVLSEGSALEGVIADQYDAYVGQLDQHVKSYWDLPRWLSEEKIACTVSVRIDSRGFVIAKRIIKSSGNPSFDDIALNTVDMASPFPPPPSNLSGALESKGFTIAFDKQEE